MLLKKKKLIKFGGFALIVSFFAALGAVFYYNLIYTQPQGRLLFPVLGAIAVFSALGMKELISMIKPPSWRRALFAVLIFALLAVDVIAVIHVQRFYHDPAQYAAAFIAGK